MKKNKPVKNQELITERNNKIKETLKSLIFPTVFALIIMGLVVFVINYQNIEKPEPEIEVHAFAGDPEEPVVMENDKLKFTMDPVTTQFSSVAPPRISTDLPVGHEPPASVQLTRVAGMESHASDALAPARLPLRILPSSTPKIRSVSPTDSAVPRNVSAISGSGIWFPASPGLIS